MIVVSKSSLTLYSMENVTRKTLFFHSLVEVWSWWSIARRIVGLLSIEGTLRGAEKHRERGEYSNPPKKSTQSFRREFFCIWLCSLSVTERLTEFLCMDFETQGLAPVPTLVPSFLPPTLGLATHGPVWQVGSGPL